MCRCLSREGDVLTRFRCPSTGHVSLQSGCYLPAVLVVLLAPRACLCLPRVARTGKRNPVCRLHTRLEGIEGMDDHGVMLCIARWHGPCALSCCCMFPDLLLLPQAAVAVLSQSFDPLKGLPFLDAVINEAMRMYPAGSSGFLPGLQLGAALLSSVCPQLRGAWHPMCCSLHGWPLLPFPYLARVLSLPVALPVDELLDCLQP